MTYMLVKKSTYVHTCVYLNFKVLQMPVTYKKWLGVYLLLGIKQLWFARQQVKSVLVKHNSQVSKRLEGFYGYNITNIISKWPKKIIASSIHIYTTLSMINYTGIKIWSKSQYYHAKMIACENCDCLWLKNLAFLHSLS